MANAIEILINARDNASAPIDRATVSIGSMAKAAAVSVAAFAAAQLSMQALSQAAIGVSKQFADEVEQLDRLAAMTGLTNEQLQVFRRGLERNGQQADQLNMSLRFFQHQLATNRRELALYGITSTNTFTALQQFAGALEGAGNEAEKVELAAKTLGMRNVEVAATVAQVAKNYENEYATAMSRGAVLTGETAEKMRDLDGALDDFADTARAFAIAWAEAFGPVVATMTKLLNQLNEANQRKREFAAEANAGWNRNRGMVFRVGDGVNPAPAFENGASEPFDRASWDRWWKNRSSALPWTGLGMSTQFPGMSESILSGYTFSTGNEGVGRRSSAVQPLMDLVKVMREAEPVANAYEQGIVRLSKAQREAMDVAMNAGMMIQQSITQAVMSVVTGVQSLGAAFRQLVMNIFASIAEAIAQYLGRQAAGWIVTGIGVLTGQPGIIAAGGAIRGASMAPAGGNTYVIQSIDAKTALDSLVSPTGSLRRANDRVYEVAMAGAL